MTDWSVIIAVLFGLYMCHSHEKTFKLYTHGEDLWSSPILLFPTESYGVCAIKFRVHPPLPCALLVYGFTLLKVIIIIGAYIAKVGCNRPLTAAFASIASEWGWKTQFYVEQEHNEWPTERFSAVECIRLGIRRLTKPGVVVYP